MKLSALHTCTGHQPPRLPASGTPPHSCGAQVSHQNVPQLLWPREALTVRLCVAGGCQTSRAQVLYSHTARRPHLSLRDLTQHALCHRSPSTSRLFQIILPPSPGLFSVPNLHSIRACYPSALQLATGLGPWTPLMLVFGFAFRTSGRNPPSTPEGESSEGRPH